MVKGDGRWDRKIENEWKECEKLEEYNGEERALKDEEGKEIWGRECLEKRRKGDIKE